MIIAVLLRTGWWSAAMDQLPSRTTLGWFADTIERTPELRGITYIKWFHYLLLFTLGACFLQVFLSLIKPVRATVLLWFNWGILFGAAGAMLFFWLFGLRERSPVAGALLAVQASALSASLAMHMFARAFLEYPEPLSDERIARHRRLYLHRPSALMQTSKQSSVGRWRRRLLAWRLSFMRDSRLGRAMRRPSYTEPDAQTTRLHLLYICPGLTLVVLLGFWSAQVLTPDSLLPRILSSFMAIPMLGAAYAWGLIVNKVMMDYRLGDTTVRRRVLWLMLGLALPAYLTAPFCLGIAYAFFAPQILPYLMLFMLAYFPVIAFLVFVLSLMISVFFYGAIDPERVLRVGTLYGFLSLVLTVLFAIVEQMLSPILINAIGLEGMEGAVVSATVVALSFRPLRDRIEAGIERSFTKLLGGNPQLPATPDLAQTGTGESAG